MANSTQMITDITTVITNGPNAATQALALAASGVIMDYVGMSQLALLQMYELLTTLNLLVGDTSASDATNLTLLENIIANLH
jgi:hypothetical protein